MIQIVCGPPHLEHWLSPRDQQMFDYMAISGEVWSAWVDGEHIACWGVIPHSFLSDSAYVWMLDLPCSHPFVLARHSRDVCDALLLRWPNLRGHCKLGSAKRWLEWLGAEFEAPKDGLWPFVIHRSA